MIDLVIIYISCQNTNPSPLVTASVKYSRFSVFIISEVDFFFFIIIPVIVCCLDCINNSKSFRLGYGVSRL